MEFNRENKASIKYLFNTISTKYDKLNFLMSFGLQKSIKKRAVKNAIKNLQYKPLRILDLCCGTGDIAVLLKKTCPDAEIVAVDFSKEMLEIAKKRSNEIHFFEKDVFQLGEEIPFEKESFDICFISFGLRNLPDIDDFLEYIKFYLKPKGLLAILDLGKPIWYMNWYFKLHYNIVIPFFAKIFSNDKKAYEYFVLSSKTYPEQSEIRQKLVTHGYKNCRNYNYSFGVIAQQIGYKED